MLFNIFKTDFKDKVINKDINKHLYVYDYCYAILNKYKKALVVIMTIRVIFLQQE